MTREMSWARAYARQARVDLQTREVLLDSKEVPDCHDLLFLQMACEKLTKAQLCEAGSDPSELHRSHAYIARNLPIVVRNQLKLKNPGDAEWVFKHSRHLAREIELLAPAVKRGGKRPDNCEYPWEDAKGRIYSPIDWTFAPSRLLDAPAGRTFLKLVRDAIDRLL